MGALSKRDIIIIDTLPIKYTMMWEHVKWVLIQEMELLLILN